MNSAAKFEPMMSDGTCAKCGRGNKVIDFEERCKRCFEKEAASSRSVKLVIELEIAGDAADALVVIDDLLDNGVIQDPINNHDHDDARQLKVVSATCRAVTGR